MVEVKAEVTLHFGIIQDRNMFLRYFKGVLLENKFGEYFFLEDNIAFIVGKDLTLIKKLWNKELKIRKGEYNLKPKP